MKKVHLLRPGTEGQSCCGRHLETLPYVNRYDENSLFEACKSCQNLSCEDCMGTGIRSRNGKPTTVGVFCGCDFDVEYDFFGEIL